MIHLVLGYLFGLIPVLAIFIYFSAKDSKFDRLFCDPTLGPAIWILYPFSLPCLIVYLVLREVKE